MSRIFSIIFVPIFIFYGCQEKKTVDSNYTVVTVKGNYVTGAWNAKTSREAINQVRKIWEAIPADANLPAPQGTARQAGMIIAQSAPPKPSYTGVEGTTAKTADILPKDDQVKGWKIAGKVETYRGKNLGQFMLSDAEVYYVYNFVELAVAEYRNLKLGKEPLLRLEVYDMGTPENAFGIYSFNRNPQSDFKIIGNEAAITMLTLDTWKEKYFVHIRIYEFSDDIKEGMENIDRYVMNKIRGTAKPPVILKLLPKDHLVRNSERYFKNHVILNKIHFIADENILNLNESTVGLVAEYVGKSRNLAETMLIFIIKYPTSNDAAVAYSSYRIYLLGKGYPIIKTKKLGDKSIVIKTPA